MSSWRFGGRSFSFPNGWFVGSMLIFQGVTRAEVFVGFCLFLFYIWDLWPIQKNWKMIFQANHHASLAWMKAFQRPYHRYFQFVILPLTTKLPSLKSQGLSGWNRQVASWHSFTTLQKPSLDFRAAERNLWRNMIPIKSLTTGRGSVWDFCINSWLRPWLL